MSKANKQTYDNESIVSLKGADRVRKRPGVIFGSDGLDGCEHAVFEILSNSIDEARAGHGSEIIVNYTDSEFTWKDRPVKAMSYELYPGSPKVGEDF